MTELPQNTQAAILAAIKRGNSVEVKREKDKLVVVELSRKVLDKSTATNG